MNTQTKRVSVYDLEARARVLIEALEDAPTEEERDAVADLIDGWDGDAIEKLTAIRHVRSRLLAESDYLDMQAKEWAARASRRKRDAERVEELARSLADAYQLATGKARVDTADGSWIKAVVRTSSAVCVDDIDALPDDLVRVTKQAEKAEIKRRIEAGETVPGARIESRATLAAMWGK